MIKVTNLEQIEKINLEELRKRKIALIDFILSKEQIEICYNIETRIKIAEEYTKKVNSTINKNTLEAIVKEENLGKIKGKINQISVI